MFIRPYGFHSDHYETAKAFLAAHGITTAERRETQEPPNNYKRDCTGDATSSNDVQ